MSTFVIILLKIKMLNIINVIFILITISAVYKMWVFYFYFVMINGNL